MIWLVNSERVYVIEITVTFQENTDSVHHRKIKYWERIPEYCFTKDSTTNIIIIIIMSCHRHGYPWPLLATYPYSPLPLASLQGYIPYPHRAAVCMFELVVLLLFGHMWGSIGVHHLWARPCFSRSVLHVWYV